MGDSYIKLLDKIFKFFTWMGMTLLVFMILIVSSNVFSRYFLSVSFRWSDEVSIILLSWFSMIAIALGIRLNLHIAIQFIVEKFPNTIKKKVIFPIVNIAIFLLGLVFMIYGTSLMLSGLDATLPATGLPSTSSYLFVPISGILIIAISLERFVFSKYEHEFDNFFEKGEY